MPMALHTFARLARLQCFVLVHDYLPVNMPMALIYIAICDFAQLEHVLSAIE